MKQFSHNYRILIDLPAALVVVQRGAVAAPKFDVKVGVVSAKLKVFRLFGVEAFK